MTKNKPLWDGHTIREVTDIHSQNSLIDDEKKTHTPTSHLPSRNCLRFNDLYLTILEPLKIKLTI